MKVNKGFASDNWSGVCPEIMEAIQRVNKGHVFSYGEGNEAITQEAIQKFKAVFGEAISVFFVYNGTAANVLGIGHLLRPYQAIVTAHSAHLNEDECGAPEKISGNKILSIETKTGKITADQVTPFLHSFGFQHHVQPRLISISQVTEFGTVYTPHEIRQLADFAHDNNMLLHVDGARIANAAVALGLELREITTDVGVDVLSFGGTKNGLMFGETVIFFNQQLGKDFEYTRKQGMQLHSKMRFIAAQFSRYLQDDLWKNNAQNANLMAHYLFSEIEKIPQLTITQEAPANGVFVQMPEYLIPAVQKKYFFHVWNETTHEVRLMCSWDTTREDVDGLISAINMEL
ncbi:MAG: threonine aldolase [Bacteroidetes bacterium CG18_big_fil_WC_8_21_14_2_50_41_14]|nr:MAG: threonine aldolase [Bacteroidetes bacterium CG18_big_fil_WC_8_21_14_2_50_41_14]PJB59599.1 MAG: threonine aldolase [Bacteroidetes bacterium CG_4_9_14_3_um_filter_41_19]